MGVAYQPDLLFHDGAFLERVALDVSADGKVVSVREASGPVVRLPGRALLPGLVNAHSHAFQRLIRGRAEYAEEAAGSDDFWSWRERMYQAASALDPDGVFVASRQAFIEMALAGITTAGEFHYLHHQPDGTPYADRNELAHQVIRAARAAGIRICLLRAGYARAGFQKPENPRQRRFIDGRPDDFLRAASDLYSRHKSDPHVAIGLAPHSVRAVPRSWLEALGARPEVVHMHVSEQPAEVEACRAEHGKTPVELLDELGLLRPDFTAVHAVHLTPSDVQLLGKGEVSICACPSTERDLGDGIVPADQLLHAGARVCLGSDSQAAIDLLDEARQLEGHLRLVRLRRAVLDPGGGRADGLAGRLFRFATAGGGEALGMPVGELVPGRPADFFTVDLGHPSLAGASRGELLASIAFGCDKAAVREVAVGGRLIIEDGRHPLLEESSRAFSALARKVFG